MKESISNKASGGNGNIDWNRLYERIGKLGKVIDRGWAPTEEEQQQILKGRARKLAEEPEAVDESKVIKIIEFELAYETYALESLWVRKVAPLKDLTPVPGSPPFILGVTNVKGEIITVFDLRKLFSLEDKGLTDFNKLVILRSRDKNYGILADLVGHVREIKQKQFQASQTLEKGRENYVKGVTKEHLILLDGKKLLNSKINTRS